MEIKHIFTNRAEIRNIDKENVTITHVVNTKVLDRHGTIVLPKGVVVDSYMKNPVVLAIHNGHQLPIGKCINLNITEDKIEASTLFNKNDPVSMQFFKAFEDGFLNAWSIGFIPLKYKQIDEENFKDINEKYSLNVTLEQITNAGYWGIYLIYEWEMLEYSAVPIPANPEALNELVTRGFSVVEDGKTEGKDIREVLKEKIEAEKALEVKVEPKVEDKPAEDTKPTLELAAPVVPAVLEKVEVPMVTKEEFATFVDSTSKLVSKIDANFVTLSEKLLTIENSIKDIVVKANSKVTKEEVVEMLKQITKDLGEVKTSLAVDNIDAIREADQKTKENSSTGGWLTKHL